MSISTLPPGHSPVTAKDVARELDLSQPTVSRILSGDVRHRASEKTRRRVREAAERLGYQPNAVARSLRHGRTNVIGLHTRHTCDGRNDFLGTIIGALQVACGTRHFDLMLHNVSTPPAATTYRRLRDGRIDGLILHASNDDPLVEILGRSPLPIVAIADPLPNLPSVTCDDEGGMRQMVDLLWQRGHRNYVFLAPCVWLPSVEKRQMAFEAELKRRNVAPTARRIISIDFEQSAAALDELLQAAPVVACCWNDRTAYNLLHECARRGVRVPQEIAITGFDGFRDEQLPVTKLATINCPWAQVAETAFIKLLELIESRQNQRAAPPFDEIRLPVTIMQGDTI